MEEELIIDRQLNPENYESDSEETEEKYLHEISSDSEHDLPELGPDGKTRISINPPVSRLKAKTRQ